MGKITTGQTYSVWTTSASAGNSLSARADKRRQDRLDEMRKAVSLLESMPSPESAAKQLAAQRAAMLKQQLESLRQMLIGASPREAKALAALLRNIARELASLARYVGNTGDDRGDSGAQAVSSADMAGVPAEASRPVESTADKPAADEGTKSGGGGDDEDAVGDTQASTRQLAASLAGQPGNAGKSGSDEEADKSLRQSLAEALTALRACIALLKKRRREGEKEVEAACRSAAEVEQTIRAGGEVGLPLPSTLQINCSVGGNVDVAA